MRRCRQHGVRLTALALAVCAAGGCCLRLAGRTGAAQGLWDGLVGLTFVGAPPSAGQTLLHWLTGQGQTADALAPSEDGGRQDGAPSDAAPGGQGGGAWQPAGTVQESPVAQWNGTLDQGAPGTGDGVPAQTAPSESGQPSPESQTPAPDPAPDALPEGWRTVRSSFYPATGEGERYIPLAAGSVRNLTDYTAAQVAQAAAAGPAFAVQLDSDQPQVLIMHTHTTECYAEVEGRVSPDNNGRTTALDANMAAVGAVLAEVLNAAGICTVQDTTLHDYPSYNGSYGRSCATVEEWLAAYPSIRVVLDVHRDAIENDGTRIAPTAVIDGRRAAQIMIICGADDGTMGMPDFWQNLGFAAALEAAAEAASPGLMRPVLFDYRNYNQQLTTGSLLLEMGGHGNTLEEAQYSARLIGQALAQLLRAGA